MITIVPFKHAELVEHIPQVYVKNESGYKDYSWFVTAPRFTTLRINTKKYSTEDVLENINQQLLKEAEINNLNLPEVYVHNVIKDCIIISNWQEVCENVSSEYMVVVDVDCANAVLRGADIFAPGILSLSPNAKIGSKVNILADVERKCKRGFNKPFNGKTVFIGIGIVKITRNELFRNNIALSGVGVQVKSNLFGIPRLKFSDDIGLLQNYPSIVCGHLLSNIYGNILDMCASPGNKTTHIATILGEKGEVIALDKTPGKVSKISKLCERFGITNVKCFVCDSTKCIAGDENDINSNGPPFKKESFSAVLLDPPCSALGQRPSLMNGISIPQLKSYPALQKRLFQSAVTALCKGGLLVYSTCTITLEENEEMVSWALKNFQDLCLKKVEPSLGRPGLEESSLNKNELDLVSRYGFPNGRTVEEDTIGFFIACFYKKR